MAASKDKPETAAATTAAAEPSKAEPAKAGEPKRDVTGRGTDCVVDDGTPHMGRAVDGKVCSAHSIHYNRDGSRRK